MAYYIILLLWLFILINALILLYRIESNKLISCFFNYKVDKELDIRLRFALNSGINHVKEDTHYLSVTFNNTTVCKFWNSNKYYAWASKGILTYISANEYSWDNARPKRRTLIKLNKAIKDYEIKKFIHD